MSEIRMTRRAAIQRIAASAGLAITASGRASARPPDDRGFQITLPDKVLPMPEGLETHGAAPGFKHRGIKGLSWIPSQYLETIPVMAAYKMNFLMNCYTSMWDLEPEGTWARLVHTNINHWYLPLPNEKKAAYARVVRECQRRGIDFCFSMNPILDSDRPFDYTKPQDTQALWVHYAWMQDLGVRWFNISLDDISHGIDARSQTKVVNEMLWRLRLRDRGVSMIFTPTWYAGTGVSGRESPARLGAGDTPGVRYTKELARSLDPDVFLYWTGPQVCSLTITHEDAETYRRLAKHRLFIWDNYPCNDQRPDLQLGPLMGRAPGLATSADGYISNPLSPQVEANWIPMLTIADYTWNPGAYNPTRSIGQAILRLGNTRPQQLALKDLVELYPGRLVAGSRSTGWNSVLHSFRSILHRGPKRRAQEFIARAAGVSERMAKLFPNRYTLARNTLDADIAIMRKQYSAKFSAS